jgi:aspartate/methionine/tyrosine aminotransferase
MRLISGHISSRWNPGDEIIYPSPGFPIYENIVFDGRKHFSIASVPCMASRTFISSGMSKSFAWTGGRIGYAVLPTIEEADLDTLKKGVRRIAEAGEDVDGFRRFVDKGENLY